MKHGKNTQISVDNAAGQLTDISQYCDNVDFPGLNADTAETTTFNADSKSYVPGLKGGTFSISGPWDETADAVLAGIHGKEGSFSYVPGGGTVTYSGEAICTAYNIQSGIGGAVTFSASFQISGDVGRA
jgi:hypothetical protein